MEEEPRGVPGIGFILTPDGNYNIENKKLVNVKKTTSKSDVSTKQYVDTKTILLNGVRPGYITNDKAVIYSETGAVHAKSFYLQDNVKDEVRILTENQDYDNVHLYVPNLKHFEGEEKVK